MKNYPSVDAYLTDQSSWQAEQAELVEILRETGLDEAIKWGQPMFMDNGKNIAIIGAFKDKAILSFIRGAILTDPAGVLQFAGENSRTTKFLAFTSLDEVRDRRALLEAYLAEAVALTRAGKRVPKRDPEDIEYVDALQDRMEEDPAFRRAFEALTPGRRRGYNIHVGGAKTHQARLARIERNLDRIFAGKGFQDCICGHSKRMPRCDGSHKNHT
jgi:uncharacterized protein YdeI (YjbR/CyaY-like superfamily)